MLAGWLVLTAGRYNLLVSRLACGGQLLEREGLVSDGNHGGQTNELAQISNSGWVSRSVKHEMHDNFLRMLSGGDELFPGIVGYDDTVIPEVNIALLAGHDMLFLGEKGQAKSRLMRLLARFLDPEIPYIDIPAAPLHDDPYKPITSACRKFVADAFGGGSADRLVARAKIVMPSGSPPAQNSPTSSAKSTRPSSPAARACRPKRPCTSA